VNGVEIWADWKSQIQQNKVWRLLHITHSSLTVVQVKCVDKLLYCTSGMCRWPVLPNL